MKRRKGLQPYPWYVEARQWSSEGKPSRPRIVDATGKPVRLSSIKQATLAALAPLLLDRLEALMHQATMMHMQVESALGFNTKKPKELIEAEEIVTVANKVL